MNLNDPIENIQLRIYNDDNIDNSYSLKNTNETLFEVDGVLNIFMKIKYLNYLGLIEIISNENIAYNWYSDNQLIKLAKVNQFLGQLRLCW